MKIKNYIQISYSTLYKNKNYSHKKEMILTYNCNNLQKSL